MSKKIPGIPLSVVNDTGLTNGVGSLGVCPMLGMLAASRIG